MFTDDDLNSLKECFKQTPVAPAIIRDLKIEALLARLEAAEACVRYAGVINVHFQRESLWATWRKSCGK